MEKMTKAQLIELSKSLGLEDVSASWTKAEIIEILEAYDYLVPKTMPEVSSETQNVSVRVQRIRESMKEG